MTAREYSSVLAAGQPPVGHFVLHKVAKSIWPVIVHLQWLFFAALSCFGVPGIGFSV
jgi:hypothetical protein